MVYNTITNLCHCYQPLEQLVPKTVRINPFIVIIKSMLLVIDSHTFGCLSFRNYLSVFSIFFGPNIYRISWLILTLVCFLP